MKTASASVWRRCAAQASNARGVFSARCRSESRSMARQCAGATKVGSDSACGSAGARGDDAATVPGARLDRQRRQETTVARVIVTSSSGTSSWPPRAGANLLDRVDDVLARDDAAEDGVAPALRRLRLEVQELVVGSVDEELRRGRVRCRGARHRQRVLVVLQAVAGFVLDRRAGRLLVHAGLEAAALDHEALDDAVEHRAVVVAVLDVGQEVLDRLGGFLVVELDPDGAGARFQIDLSHRLFLHGRLLDHDLLQAEHRRRRWAWRGSCRRHPCPRPPCRTPRNRCRRVRLRLVRGSRCP